MSSATPNYFAECYINNKEQPCADLLPESLTDEGICRTFNGLSANELLRTETLQTVHPYINSSIPSNCWTLEGGFSPKANLSAYPRRILGPGVTSGITFVLKTYDTHHDESYVCRLPVQGYKVHLHSPADYPQVLKKHIHIPLNQQVKIAVKPQIITTDGSLRDYSPERRQCFFNHERFLQFFRVYTQDNCELECLTNYTAHFCGCVRFSMLRTKNGTPVCGAPQLYCMLQAEKRLHEMNPSGDSFRVNCNCLPACSSTQYDLEITQTNLARVSAGEFAMSHVGVYYKEAQFMASRRSELFGWSDFLANCGGLLGLFMGVSLLSFVELVYFCAVRPCVLWRRNGRRDRVSVIRVRPVVIKLD